MPTFRFLGKTPNIDFIGAHLWAFAFTGITLVVSIVSLFVQGLNLGIDFTGGVLIELKRQEGTIDVGAMRTSLESLDLGEVQLQSFGAGDEALIRVQPSDGKSEQEAVNVIRASLGCVHSLHVIATDDPAIPENLRGGGVMYRVNKPAGQAVDQEALRTAIGKLNVGSAEVAVRDGAPEEAFVRVNPTVGTQVDANQLSNNISQQLGCPYEFRRQDAVGPKVSDELFFDGIMASILAVIFIALYVTVRFEWQFGVASIIATGHDVFVTVGLFSLLQLDFNLTAIAALLTLAGYSINDTVVVFDRVRENRRKHKRMPLPELLNLSTNQTLSRTILTSVTTAISIIPLTVWGGPALFNFSASILFGIVLGTYSSIYVASAILLYMPTIGGMEPTKTAVATVEGP